MSNAENARDAESSVYVAIGDIVCFYADGADGYMCNVLFSSVFNTCSVQQSKEDRCEMPTLHGIQFEIFPPSRYKVGKQYRKLLAHKRHHQHVNESQLQATKALADAEVVENEKENRRNHGRFLRYGDTVQFRHVYTNMWLHIDDIQTSRIEKSSMMIRLFKDEDASAHFRILPRYKVKNVGDLVQIHDKVVLESVKSRGNFWHVSAIASDDLLSFGTEVNANAEKTGFTVVKSARSSLQKDNFVRSGDFVQLFHKDMSSYLCAEGVFDFVVTEQPHVRKSRKGNVRFAHGSSFAGTYWQIEEQDNSLHGDKFTVTRLMRLRHVLTRRYLSMDCSTQQPILTHDESQSGAVFRMVPIVDGKNDFLTDCTCVAIENAQSGMWLNVDEQVKARKQQKNKLQWDFAEQRAILFSADKRSSGAFCVSRVSWEEVNDVNTVAGLAPILLNFHYQRESQTVISPEVNRQILVALREFSTFVDVTEGEEKFARRRVRRNLLRDLKIVDLLTNLLKLPLDGPDSESLLDIMREVINILLLYVSGASRKNLLYISAYHDFFGARLEDKPELSASIIELLAGMMRDNRDIIQSVTPSHLTYFIDLFMSRQDHTYLDLLQVLCICNGTSRSSNQITIGNHWLSSQDIEYPVALHTFQLVREFGKKVLYINLATDGKHVRWVPLVEAVHKSSAYYKENVCTFLIKQLALMAALCYGANEFCMNLIAKDGGFLPIDVVFTAITYNDLPDKYRAAFCSVVPDLFIRVPRSYNVSVLRTNCVEYDDLNTAGEAVPITQEDSHHHHSPETVEKVAYFKDWVIQYLALRRELYADEIDANIFLARVLEVAQQFLLHGLLTDSIMERFVPPLVLMLDGRTDLPSRNPVESMDTMEYQTTARFDKSPETSAIVKVKLAGLGILKIVLDIAERKRFHAFLTLFKATNSGEMPDMDSLLEELCVHPRGRRRVRESTTVTYIKKVLSSWQCMPDAAILRKILIDLSKYKYEKLLFASLNLLRLLHESADTMFSNCEQAMLIVSTQSKKVYAELEHRIPTLKVFAMLNQSEKEQRMVTKILQRLSEMCFVSKRPRVIADPTNQRILESYGVLDVLLNWLRAEAALQATIIEPARVDLVEQVLAVIEGMICENSRLQEIVFANIHVLLQFDFVPHQLARTIRQIFLGNEKLCIGLQAAQIRQLASLVGCQPKFSGIEVLDALMAVVRLQKVDLPLKDHQAAVVKGLTVQHEAVIRVLEMKEQEKLDHLLGKNGQTARAYILKLVELLALCADSDNDYIDSLCQMLVPLDEIVDLLCNSACDLSIKATYLRYLTVVYVRKLHKSSRTTSGIYTGMMQNKRLFEMVRELNEACMRFIDMWASLATEVRREALVFRYTEDVDHRNECSLCMRCENDGPMSVSNAVELHRAVHFMLTGLFDFLVDFLSKFCVRHAQVLSKEKWAAIDLLCRHVEAIAKCLIPYLTFEQHRQVIVLAMRALLKYRSLWTADEGVRNSILEVLQQMSPEKLQIVEPRQEVLRAYNEYYEEEMALNRRLAMFTSNCQKLWQGPNTIKAQLSNVHAFGSNLYSTPEAPLPLGEEFQQHVDSFIELDRPFEPFEPVGRLVCLLSDLYRYRNRRQAKPRDSLQDEKMIISTLQVLRAFVQREMCRLPEDWEELENDKGVENILKRVNEMQDMLIEHEVWEPMLVHLEDKNDRIIQEVFLMQHTVLFNANASVQKALIICFENSRDEAFFPVMKDLLERSACEFKQQRMVETQRALAEMRSIEKLPDALSLHSQSTNTGEHLHPDWSSTRCCDDLDHNFLDTDGTDEDVQAHAAHLLEKPVENKAMTVRYKQQEDVEEDAYVLEEEISRDSARRNVELVLSIVAQMCDGQCRELQDYLRDQPDNFLSVNIPAEIIGYLRVLCVRIDGRNIGLVASVIDALSELCTGSQENREDLLTNKIMEQINFVLRSRVFPDCEAEQVVELYSTVGKLIYAIVEEDGEKSTQSALDVTETLDMNAFLRILCECYVVIRGRNSNEIDNNEMFSSQEGPFDKIESRSTKEDITELGQLFGLILKRFFDVDPNMRKKWVKEENRAEIAFFQKNILSVEIVKNHCLQKVNFHCPYQRILREELKDTFKWQVERTTRDQKISGLIEYSGDIIDDMVYTKHLLSVPPLIMLCRTWKIQNYIFTLFTLAINIYMLVTNTIVPGGFIDPSINVTLPFNPLLDSYQALIWGDKNVMTALGVTHIILSCIIICTYFVAYHPSVSFKKPKVCKTRQKTDEETIIENVSEKDAETEMDGDEPVRRKLSASLFSFLTLFYVLALATSFAGLFVSPLFYVFHLLNIINCVDMVRYVISAVKRSSSVIMWILVLVLIVSYFFGVIGILYFRSTFDPNLGMYCSTLYECTLTVGWSGMVGLLYINQLPNVQEYVFGKSVLLAVYQVAFYLIVTVLLLGAVLFGSVVDSFSKLRRAKDEALDDMREVCFVCNITAYEFDHRGKGFLHHVHHEHNLWHYIFYMMRLKVTPPTDYGSIDLHVFRNLKKGNYEFFPLNQARCLEIKQVLTMEKRAKDIETKLDEILQIHEIQEDQRRIRTEIRKQQRWHQKVSRPLNMAEGTLRRPMTNLAEEEEDLIDLDFDPVEQALGSTD